MVYMIYPIPCQISWRKSEHTTEEPDRYKRDALKTTREKVNGGFGGIFAELLSGTFAKLQPPDILDLMDVLEIEVQLGTVWKTGLTKLSGGQRSLIGLSLIMVPPRFKPALMYILDEIDTAPDLSHTQHIETRSSAHDSAGPSPSSSR